jgi:hypothetical protein
MIELDKNISDKLNSGMSNGETIELPFPHVFMWTHNGQTAYKQHGNALFYGGWMCDSDSLTAAMEMQGLTLPAGWNAVTITNREGVDFEACVTRSIMVAPIAYRVSWLTDGRRAAQYSDGARRHVQALAYMAEKAEQGWIPWGPVVLSAKGYQARNLLDSFGKWEKAISPVRRKIAPTVPAWCFYLAVGTFGKERKVENVGKAGTQSPITPISVYVPDTLDEAMLTKLFVGQETAGIMAELADQAQDWIEAWKGEAETTASANGHNRPQSVDDDFLVPDDERPF